MSRSKLVENMVLNGLKTTIRVFRNAIVKECQAIGVRNTGPAFSALEESGLVKKIYVKGAVAYEAE